MPRAYRHYTPGYVWHITHRCHKKEFLLKFSIAVGNLSFIEKMKSNLGIHAKRRKAQEFENRAYALREPEIIYNAHLIPKKDDIGLKNTYLWDIDS